MDINLSLIVKFWTNLKNFNSNFKYNDKLKVNVAI